MGDLNRIKEALKGVYDRKTYLLLTLTFSFLIFSSNSFFRNYKLLFSEFSFSLFFNLIFTTHQSLPTISFLFLLITSLLAGIVFSFGFFLTKKQIKSGIGMGLSGILVGMLTPACPSCALGLFGILGLGGVLAVLPFKGMELGVLGIVILLFYLVYLSRKITATACNIKK